MSDMSYTISSIPIEIIQISLSQLCWKNYIRTIWEGIANQIFDQYLHRSYTRRGRIRDITLSGNAGLLNYFDQ